MSRDLRTGRVALRPGASSTATTPTRPRRSSGTPRRSCAACRRSCRWSWPAGRAAAPPISRGAAHLVQPRAQSTLFLVPGLIGFIVMISCVVSTSLSIVREKERGTWEQVRMAPIDTRVVRRRQDHPVLRHLAGVGPSHHRRRDGASSACPCGARGSLLLAALSLYVVGALGTGLLVSTLVDSQALAFLIEPADLAAADVHPVGLHLPDREHARADPGHHLHRAGAVLPGACCAGIVLKGADRRRRCAGRLAGAGPLRRRRCSAWRRCGWRRSEADMRRAAVPHPQGVPGAAPQPADVPGACSSRPVIQLAILGYAATTDVKNVPLVVVDADRSPSSRDLIGRFEGSPYFTVVDVVVERPRGASATSMTRRAWMALSIPPATDAWWRAAVP